MFSCISLEVDDIWEISCPGIVNSENLRSPDTKILKLKTQLSPAVQKQHSRHIHLVRYTVYREQLIFLSSYDKR